MTITMTRTGCLCLGLCVVLATTGCQTVPAGNYAGFATGVTTARNQAQLAFQEFTDLTNDAIIDYAAKQPTLQETNFFVVLDPAAVAGWDVDEAVGEVGASSSGSKEPMKREWPM